MSRIVLLFPGQGSQYVGMGKDSFKNHGIVRNTFEEAEEALGINLRKICFEDYSNELVKTENTQPAILTLSTAMFRVFMDRFKIEPEFMAGHSLGEFTALTCSGSISFSDAVKLVQKRGKFMQEAGECTHGAMLAISGFEGIDIKEECSKFNTDDKFAVVSNYNSPNQIVISGHVDVVNSIKDKMEKYGAKATLLKVSAAFHSPLMKLAEERFKNEIAKYKFSNPKCTVISNVTARPYCQGEEIAEILTSQLTSAVRWEESLKFLAEENIELAVEMGPGKILKNLMKRNSYHIKTYSYDSTDDIPILSKTLEQLILSKNIITKCLAAANSTKNLNWDNDEYYEGVIKPYKELQKIYDKYRISKETPIYEDVKFAIELIKVIFNTKKVHIKEQTERFRQIFSDADNDTKKYFSDLKLI